MWAWAEEIPIKSNTDRDTDNNSRSRRIVDEDDKYRTLSCAIICHCCLSVRKSNKMKMTILPFWAFSWGNLYEWLIVIGHISTSCSMTVIVTCDNDYDEWCLLSFVQYLPVKLSSKSWPTSPVTTYSKY